MYSLSGVKEKHLVHDRSLQRMKCLQITSSVKHSYSANSERN